MNPVATDFTFIDGGEALSKADTAPAESSLADDRSGSGCREQLRRIGLYLSSIPRVRELNTHPNKKALPLREGFFYR